MDSLSQQFLDAARADDVNQLRNLLKEERKATDDVLDINFKDEWTGATALHMAAANGNIRTLQFLLTECHPRPLYTLNTSSNSPLHWALQNAQWEAAKLLLTSNSTSYNSKYSSCLCLVAISLLVS